MCIIDVIKSVTVTVTVEYLFIINSISTVIPQRPRKMQNAEVCAVRSQASPQ